VSPSASVALPVSENGVRVGMVKAGAVVTSGAWLPVSVTVKPWFWIGPPRAVSPMNAVAPLTTSPSGSRLTAPSVPPYVTWKPVSSNVPAPNPAMVTICPAVSVGAPPLVVSATVPVAPEALVTENGSTSVFASVPPKASWWRVSATMGAVTVAPAGQPAIATLP
jgi:hypothetical protein